MHIIESPQLQQIRLRLNPLSIANVSAKPKQPQNEKLIHSSKFKICIRFRNRFYYL